MNNTDPNGMNIFNVKPEGNKQVDVEIIGEQPTFNNRVPDNFNDQKYIIDKESKATSTYTDSNVNIESTVLYKTATARVDFNEQALTTLNEMLEKLKQAPATAKEELYESISLWFEENYIDEEAEDGFKIIDYDTYVEMLKLLVAAEDYV